MYVMWTKRNSMNCDLSIFPVECVQLIGTSGGPYQSPLYPENYLDNQRECWLISLNVTGKVVETVFTDFQTELDKDYVRVSQRIRKF